MSVSVVAESDSRFKESPDEIIVEVRNDGNHPWMFPPIGITQNRPYWSNANMTRTGRLPHNSIAKMPDIPGIRFGVNVKTKTCRWFDPLAHEPGGADLWDQVKGIVAKNRQHLQESRIEKAQHFFFECTPTELKTWLYWLRRGVETKDLTVMQGTMPTLNDIARMPGKTEIGQFDVIGHKRKYREDQPDYEKPAGEPETVGAGGGGSSKAGGQGASGQGKSE